MQCKLIHRQLHWRAVKFNANPISFLLDELGETFEVLEREQPKTSPTVQINALKVALNNITTLIKLKHS